MPQDFVAPDSAPAQAMADAVAADLIARCGGDPRAALVALLGAVEQLEGENRLLRRAASPGFARRKFPDDPPSFDPPLAV